VPAAGNLYEILSCKGNAAMDNDATTLQDALAVLRRHYGDRVTGAQRSTEAQMRHTLQEQMGLDELAADRVLKQLSQTGRVVYMGSRDVGSEPGTSTTGPVISMPLTSTNTSAEPLITTAAPALAMGSVNDPGGGAVDASLSGAASSDVALTGAGAVSADPVRGGDVGRAVAENNSGATMGQLADTSVEPAPAPITIGEREEVEDDRTEGYWRIG
jgi:hypothetical protein